MRALEVARALKAVSDPSRLATQFLRDLPLFPALDDVAVITQRFARHTTPPSASFFGGVAEHIEATLRGCGSVSSGCHISCASVAVLADAFAHVRYNAGVGALGLACLQVEPTAVLAPQDLLRCTWACADLGAQDDSAVRGFLLMRFQGAVQSMEPCDLSESGGVLAGMGIYSPELAAAIELRLEGDPWSFALRDIKNLLPHFSTWKLGLIQKRAFQTLGLRFSESTEVLSPQDAVAVIDVFTAVGSVNEVLLQHLYLRLLLDRSFVELPPKGLACLAISMHKVEHYHAGLLREIVAHVCEVPSLVASWTATDLNGVLRTFGLAPVHVPAHMLRLFGCRFGALLPTMDAAALRDFFEVSARHPELLRASLIRGGGRTLAALLRSALPQWAPSACADAWLALVLAMDSSPSSRSGLGGCACVVARPPQAPQNSFRTDQPEDQLRVVMKATVHWRQKDHRPKELKNRYGPNAILNHIFLVDDPPLPAHSVWPPRCCGAPWALSGRRSRKLVSVDPVQLLGLVIPHLLGRLQGRGRDLGEIPGMPSSAALLEPTEAASPKDSTSPLAATGLLTSTTAVDLLEIDNTVSNQAAASHGELCSSSSVSGHAVSSVASKSELWQETTRRSELLEVGLQVLTTLQLSFGPGLLMPAIASPQALSLASCRAVSRITLLVDHLLRPRRTEDGVVTKYRLGPHRLEAFIRRPDEKLVKDVRITLVKIMPFIPRLLGWEQWPARRVDQLEGRVTGGALISLQHEVEVPPFVICVVLRHKPKALNCVPS